MAYHSGEDQPAGTNWASSVHYGAGVVHRPADAAELTELILRGERVRALGSRHSFTDLADTSGSLISLDRFAPDLVIDEDARTASFSAGIRYGDLATSLTERGWALHNLASLPHISVAGAVATGTHGSGDRNGNLATAVAELEFVDGAGNLVRLARTDADFDGAVVALGALGIVTRVTLDIEPNFEVRQDLYRDLPWDVVLSRFDEVTSSAYSVSLFLNWLGDTIDIAWLKSRTDAPVPPTEFFGATWQSENQHMLPGQPVSNTTDQGGVSGPWSDRLAHFKLEFTPSNGDELQSEYLLPRDRAVEAFEALRSIGSRIEPLLLVTELRTMAADRLWLSGAYDRETVGIHFTWKMLPTEVGALLPEIESILLPLGGRPHWGKVFAAEIEQFEHLYPRLGDFYALARKYDQHGLFRNSFLVRKLGLPLVLG
ncbi:MAG TPA: D-arabinono-1,4-lactone oxidase [Galbitalea sp.]|jgi:xylitol oxidase